MKEKFGAEAGYYVAHHFFMDDGFKSYPSAKKAIDVLKRTQDMLAQSNL